MKKILLFAFYFINIGLFFSFQACKSNTAVKEGESEFEYFPARNIYFNVKSSKFIYSLDGAKTWDSVKVTSRAGFAALGRREKIFSKSAEVWRDNETHLRMYEGNLVSILNESDKNNIEIAEEVTERRAVVKNASSVKKVDPPRKKGVRGFFDRVFKRKEKK